MISISVARAHILDVARANPPANWSAQQAIGLVLADDVVSDVDSPPHDKSLVDGYAVRACDVSAEPTVLDVIEEVMAGQVPRHSVRAGTATRIMTGAPLPEGADAVVMLEQTEREQEPAPDRVRITAGDVRPGQNLMRRGAALARDSVVLPAGHVVRPMDVGLLCEVGHASARVVRPPRVSVLATGNELVDAEQRPGAGQIRNSNGPMLSAMARAMRGEVVDLGICRDDVVALREAVMRGLEGDLLVLSGGVSAGTLDLVPRVLAEAGVEKVFHKVDLKPGKPMWFGVRREPSHQTLVFGLPGNPVSSLVCFELFVGPALRKLSGRANVVCELQVAQLSGEHPHCSDRPTYYPAYVEWLTSGQCVLTPLSWRGSADQRAVGAANCLAFFPPGERHYAMGETVEYLPLEADLPRL